MATPPFCRTKPREQWTRAEFNQCYEGCEHPANTATQQVCDMAWNDIQAQKTAAATYAARVETYGGGVSCPSPPNFRLQAFNNRNCVPRVWLLAQACTRQTLHCAMFRQMRWYQMVDSLRYLLSTKASRTTAEQKVFWCRDVIQTVAQALDATNLQPRWIAPPGFSIIGRTQSTAFTDFPNTRRFYDQMLQGSSYGHTGKHATRHVQIPLRQAPVTFGMGLDSLEFSAGVLSGHDTTGGMIFSSFKPRGIPGYSGSLNLTNIIRMWQAFPTADTIPASRVYVNEHAVCLDASGCPYNETKNDAELLGARLTMALCEAHALDIINAPYAAFVADGVNKWLAALEPFAARGDLGVSASEIRRHMADVARARAQSTADQAASMASGAGNVGSTAHKGREDDRIGSIFFGIYRAVVWAFASFAPMAYGYSCPPIPFKRTYDPAVAPECSFSSTTTATDTVEHYRERLQTTEDRSGIDIFQPRGVAPPPPPPPPPPPKPEVGKIVAIVAAGAVAGGLSAFLLAR